MSRFTPRHDPTAASRPAAGDSRRGRVGAVAAAGLVCGALVLTALPSAAQARDSSPLRVVKEDIAYTVPGAAFTVTAPSWATHATVTLAGAAGGGTCVEGGRGTEVTATAEVSGGESFTVSLGENGHSARGNLRMGSGRSDVVAAGGWGPSEANGGSATWRNQDGAIDFAEVAGGGGGSELRRNGVIVAIAGGGGGGGLCAHSDGGAGGTAYAGSSGQDHGLLAGGTGGGFATSHLRAGDAAINAGGGGGGAKGGGYGSSGQSTVANATAGAGGGGAGGSWVDHGMRWDTTLAADSSKGGSYATIVFANTDLRATGNLASGKPVNASSSLEHAGFASRLLTDGFTRSMAGHNAFSTDPARPTPGDGATVQEWVEVDLGESQQIGSLRLYPRTTHPDEQTQVDGAGFPAAFTVEVSTDGQTWTRVGSFSGQTDVVTPRSYSLVPVRARWLRLNVTSLGPVADGDYGHRLQLAELEIYR